MYGQNLADTAADPYRYLLNRLPSPQSDLASLLSYDFPPFTFSKIKKKKKKLRKLAVKMFKTWSSEPDRDCCLDYTNIHSFSEVLADPEEGLPKRKRKELAKEQKNAEMERKHESGFVIHSPSGGWKDSESRQMQALYFIWEQWIILELLKHS